VVTVLLGCSSRKKRETSDRPQKMGRSNESTSCLSLDETTRKCTIDMLDRYSLTETRRLSNEIMQSVRGQVGGWLTHHFSSFPFDLMKERL
jgi:predicted metalloprotease